MKRLIGTLSAACLLSASGFLYAAEPIHLTDSQLDTISAGGYAIGQGEATAGSGTVSVNSKANVYEKRNGTEVAKSKVVVKGRGTDLEGFAYSESGIGDSTATAIGAAAVDEGRFRIVVNTKVKTKSNGEVITKSTAKVKVKGA